MNNMPFMTTAYGWVYMGFDPITQEDYDLLEAYLKGGGINIEDVSFDEKSLCGRLDDEWSAEIYDREETSSKKVGGLGSHTYETQKVIGRNYGSGDVMFKDEDQRDIWHINPFGERCYGKVDYGDTGRSYHIDEWGQTSAGPKPDTRAARQLGERSYHFQQKNKWWVIR